MKKPTNTVPNTITTARLLCGAIAALLLVIGWGERAAVLLLSLGVAMDAVDGWVARRYSQCSSFGQFFDPIVDKFLTAIMFVAIAHVLNSKLIWVFVSIMFMREFIITVYRATRYAADGKSFGARGLGKLKMVLQSVTGLLLLFRIHFLDGATGEVRNFTLAALFAIVVISYLSGIEYIAAQRKRRNPAGITGG